jgi:hypothetical protein
MMQERMLQMGPTYKPPKEQEYLQMEEEHILLKRPSYKPKLEVDQEHKPIVM